MKNIAVVGLGKVGTLVGILLSKQFTVIAYDNSEPHYPIKLPFPYKIKDLSSANQIHQIVEQVDAVVSRIALSVEQKHCNYSLPKGYSLFRSYRRCSYNKLHTLHSKKCSCCTGTSMWFSAWIDRDNWRNLAKKFDTLRDIELRVGALPRYPNGQLSYSFTWSPKGVLNEYLQDAEAIHNGKQKMVPSLQGFEHMNIEGQEYEAFTTSGGLGTMSTTFAGKVDTLNYKTIRYPGHGKLMRFLLYELILKNDLPQLEQLLTNAKPPVEEDLVHVYAVVEGKIAGKMKREEFFKTYLPKEIAGHKWRAISWTTAASLAAVVELVAQGTLAPKRICETRKY